MRLLLKIGFCDEQKKERIFPRNYRVYIAEFLRQLIDDTNLDLKEKFWGRTKAKLDKPFTFSLFFPDQISENSNVIFNSNYFLINFSFGNYDNEIKHDDHEYGDYALVAELYNEVIKKSKKYIIKFDENEKINYEVNLLSVNSKMQKIKNNNEPQVFKTLSPIIIPKISQEKKLCEYVFPENEDFKNHLKENLVTLSVKFIGMDNFDVLFTPLDIKTVDLSEKNENICGFTGKFYLQAPSKIKKLIYEVGLGAKRNEGFGMIEAL